MLKTFYLGVCLPQPRRSPCPVSLIRPLLSFLVCFFLLSSHLFLSFSPTLPTVSASSSLCSSIILPSLFHLPRPFFSPICFLFSAVCNTALLCFSFLRSHFTHLREIRRKLASEKPAVKKAPAPVCVSRSLQHCETFRLSSLAVCETTC